MKILVAFSSRGVATRQIAERVAGVLTRQGIQVDTADADDVTSLDDCSAVVLGSLVTKGRWLPAATEFLESFQEELARIPLFLFSYQHRASGENDVRGGWIFPADLEGVVHIVDPQSIELFMPATAEERWEGGGDLAAAERLPQADADGPNWLAVERWAGKIADHLLREPHSERLPPSLVTGKRQRPS